MKTLMLSRVGVLAFALALGFALLGGPRSVSAAPAGSAEFEGSGHDGSRVNVTVSTDATTVIVVFTFANVTPGCPTEARFTDVALTASGNEFRAQGGPAVRGGLVVGTQSMVGFFETLRYASAVGSFEYVPSSAVDCPGRQIAWRAGSTTTSASALKFGGGYSTAAGAAIPVSGTATVGTVSLRTQESGLGLSTFSFNYRQGACSFTGELPAPRSYNAGPSLEYVDSRWAFTIASHPSSASGGIFVAADGACPALALSFTAIAGAVVPGITTPTPTPTRTPAPGANGTLSGAIPRTGGFGLVVFDGGTIDQLVTATGCPVSSMALWATVNGTFVGYVPGTTIAAPNAAFVAAFPGRVIPPATAFIGKCA